MTVETEDIKPENQSIKFSFDMKDAGMFEVDKLKLVFVNGQNTPIVKGFQNVQMMDEKVTFEAEFPFEEFVMDGLTIAAVTMGADEFANVDLVAEKAVFGPGIIEIN